MANNDLGDLFQRADEEWLRAAKRALETNDVTFAVLPVLLLTDPNGLLAKLGMMGYDVELPR